jgi:hypothetical protein
MYHRIAFVICRAFCILIGFTNQPNRPTDRPTNQPTNQPTNFTEQYRSRKTDGQSPCQEISLLWNRNVHYRVQNGPLVLILSQIHPFILFHPVSLRFILILSYHLSLGRQSGVTNITSARYHILCNLWVRQNIRTANESIENVVKFKYLGTTLSNQNDTMKSRAY